MHKVPKFDFTDADVRRDRPLTVASVFVPAEKRPAAHQAGGAAGAVRPRRWPPCRRCRPGQRQAGTQQRAQGSQVTGAASRPCTAHHIVYKGQTELALHIAAAASEARRPTPRPETRRHAEPERRPGRRGEVGRRSPPHRHTNIHTHNTPTHTLRHYSR